MTTYNTGNPIGSTDARDLYDNAQNLDNFSNGSAASYTDRLGVSRRSLSGIDAAADNVLNAIGYSVPVAYASGISLTLTSQTVDYNGVIYAPKSSALPFTTSSWGSDSVKFRAVQVTDADLITYTPAGTGAVATTVQSKLREAVSVKDFGAKCDMTTDDSTALLKSNAEASSLGIPLKIFGVMHISTPVTITVPIVDTLSQLFTATSNVTISNGLPVRPEWWGGGAAGFAKAVASADVVALADATYQSPYITSPLTKNNLKLLGTRQPRFKADKTGLEDGTIIQGSFLVQASGFQAFDLGFDSGSSSCSALNGGNAMEGLIVFTTTKVPTFKDIIVKNISAICKSPSALVHAVALENCENLVADNIRTLYGVHGQAYKCIKSNVSNIYSAESSYNGVIIKAAEVADCYLSNFNNIFIDGNSVGGGLTFSAQEGVALFNINVSGLNIYKTTYGIKFDTSGIDILSALDVSGFKIQEVAGNGVSLEGDTVRNISFSNGVVRSSGGHGVYIPNSVTDVSLCNVRSTHNSGDGFNLAAINGSQSRISDCIAFSNGGYGFRFNDGFWLTSNLCAFGNMSGKFLGYEQSATLTGGWVNYGGVTKSASFYRDGEYVVLQGLIKNGTSGASAFTLPVGFRPEKQLWFSTLSSNGATTVVVEPSGSVTVTGGNTFLSLDGVRFKYVTP